MVIGPAYLGVAIVCFFSLCNNIIKNSETQHTDTHTHKQERHTQTNKRTKRK